MPADLVHLIDRISLIVTDFFPHRTSSNFVKKKAALTLLRLYRKHPSVMPVEEWAERIVDHMDDPDPVSPPSKRYSHICRKQVS